MGNTAKVGPQLYDCDTKYMRQMDAVSCSVCVRESPWKKIPFVTNVMNKF